MDELLDEEGYDAWEGEGWSNNDSETYFYGPLELTNEVPPATVLRLMSSTHWPL
jgi:hypothetical protein